MTGAEVTRLVLVRHGHPEAYNLGIIPGVNGDTGLSVVGKAQAAALAARLARTNELGDAPVLVSSVLPRAIETAAAIAPVFDHPEWDQHCDLCEIHPGEELDGMSFEEFRQKYGDNQRSVYEPWGPGVESWAEFLARTARRLLALADEHAGRTIIVAAHGGIIDVAFRALGHLPIERRMNAQPAYTSITEWVRSADAGDEWRLVRYNDHAHLEGVDGPSG